MMTSIDVPFDRDGAFTPCTPYIIPSNEQCAELMRRKFSLVLDLDQTIIHTITTTDPEVVKENCVKEHMLLHFVYQCVPTNVHFIVFFRPYVFDFLEKMSRVYDIYVYTNAVHAYATKIVGAINSSLGACIIQRYYSRPPDTTSDYIPKFLRNVESIKSCDTIIIDDRIDVWCEDLTNVIQIRKFEGPSMKTDYTKDTDLVMMADILLNMHSVAVETDVTLLSLIDAGKFE